MKRIKCLNPNCKRKAYVRGLCRCCYTMAWKMVQQKKTTWQAMMEAGKVRQRYAPTTMWLVGK